MLLAYSKMWLFEELVASKAPDDPLLERELFNYFPEALHAFKDALVRHRLRREIIATRLANEIVDTCGPAYPYQVVELTGAAPHEVAIAYEAARRILKLGQYAADIDALDNKIPAKTQIALYNAAVSYKFSSKPKTAIAPLLLVWLGTGETPKIIVAFLIAFFPIVVNTATGMMLVEEEMLHLAGSLSASRAQVFWHIRLPNALPYTFSACKVAVTLAVVGAVIGEFVGADSGLGYLILIASSQLKTDLAFVAIFLLAALGMILFWLVSVIERLAIPWCLPERGSPAGL